MTKRLSLVLAILLLSTAAEAKSFALVIGAGDYQHLRPLTKSLQDAIDIADALKTYGFEVTLLLNPTGPVQFEAALNDHFLKLQKDTSSIGLIYYSGHGIQVNGINFLFPIQANPGSASEILTSCVDIDKFLTRTQPFNNLLNVVILEASHDNPLSAEFSLSPQGLHMINVPEKTLIATSAAPNNITVENRSALSKPLPNHTFTYYLIQALKKKSDKAGIKTDDLERIMSRVSNMVNTSTMGFEKPYVSEVRTAQQAKLIVDQRSVLERLAKDNLDIRVFANGDPIREARTPEEWTSANRNKIPVWAYYNNDSANYASHGKLYNYYTVSDPRGLVDGWQVPTKEEWQTLSIELQSSNNPAGDASDFHVSPIGLREADATFKRENLKTGWWTRSDYSAAHVYSAQATMNDSKISFVVVGKGVGYSIRLIRK